MITVAQLDVLPERLREKIAFGPDCWQWLASCERGGYGQFYFDKRMQRAHRVVYTLLIGLIPDGITLDHECRNPKCVNPDHMGFMTQAEAGKQGSDRYAANALAKTHCNRGHPWSEENTYYRTGKSGNQSRTCRICVHDSGARRYPKKNRQKRLKKEIRNANPNYIPYNPAKLTEQDVRKIRVMHSTGYTYTAIARAFNVSASTIGLLIRGITWSSVDSTEVDNDNETYMLGTPSVASDCMPACWYAISDICICPCNGKNHGIGHSPSLDG